MDNFRKLFTLGIALLATVGFASRSHADSLIYQSVPDLTAAPTGYVCSFCVNVGGEYVDFFTLASSHVITQVNFVTGPSDSNSGLGGETVRIWNSDLSTILLSQDVVPFASTQIDQPNDFSTFILSAVLSGLSLPAGTYGISFLGSDLGIATLPGGNGTGIEIDPPGCGDCVAFGQDDSGFQLYGDPVSAVPLPAALPLFASGLVGLGWLSRRKKRKLAGQPA